MKADAYTGAFIQSGGNGDEDNMEENQKNTEDKVDQGGD